MFSLRTVDDRREHNRPPMDYSNNDVSGALAIGVRKYLGRHPK
jgi:hypothetical protein